MELTLHLALSTPWYASLVSDRLVTLQNRGAWAGEHDHLANKTVILVTSDAAVVLGYCGAAYIEGLTTDNWIADLVAPEANLVPSDGGSGLFGFKKRSKLRLHQVLNRLRTRLARSSDGATVSVLVVGWRIWRRRRMPVNITIRPAKSPLKDQHTRLRTTRPFDVKIRSVGANLDHVEWDTLVDNLRSQDLRSAGDTASLLADTIRRKADSNKTVGGDTMTTVIWFHPTYGLRRVECCFDPGIARFVEDHSDNIRTKRMVTYSPWFITPCGFLAPSESTITSTSSSRFDIDGWTLELTMARRLTRAPHNSGWSRPQARKPRP